MNDSLHRGGRIPEGAVIATILGVGTRQCKPVDGGECDSWKTFGLGIVRYAQSGDPVPLIYPLCKKHMQAYLEDVLFSRTTSWGNAAEELGIEMEDDDDD